MTALFNLLPASQKLWLVHPEYGYSAEEYPPSDWWSPHPGESIVDAWERCIEQFPTDRSSRIAIDMTGMMRPYLLLLPLMLKRAGFQFVTLLYSDPISYISGHETTFSKGAIERVAVVPGYGGLHRTAFDGRDCLVIGAGYDHELVKAAAESKKNAEHYLLVGLPGLQPHMYQESLYRVSQARESINDYRTRTLLFAPASNPFMTAQVLSDQIALLRNRGNTNNIYLCPVGPKTQVLGFAWYYLCEAIGTATSIVFPYAQKYSRETSSGWAAVHEFLLEVDVLKI